MGESLETRVHGALKKFGRQDLIALSQRLSTSPSALTKVLWAMQEKGVIDRDPGGGYGLAPERAPRPVITKEEINRKSLNWRRFPTSKAAKKIEPKEPEPATPVQEEPEVEEKSDEPAVEEETRVEPEPEAPPPKKPRKPRERKKPEPEAPPPSPSWEARVAAARERREQQVAESQRAREQATLARTQTLQDLVNLMKRCVRQKVFDVDDAFEVFELILRKVRKA